MFGIEYLTSFIVMFFKLGYAIVSAIFYKIAWNTIAPIYLDFLPEKYLNISYWKFVAIILVIQFVGEIISTLIPKIIKIEHKKEEK